MGLGAYISIYQHSLYHCKLNVWKDDLFELDVRLYIESMYINVYIKQK